MSILIEAIPKEKMRYDTAGDYFFRGPHLVIQVDEALSADEQFLVAVHEMVEAKLCLMRGVSFQAIDDFDMAFSGEGEPGDDPAAPYRKEHRQAMIVEHMVANFLGLDAYGKVE